MPWTDYSKLLRHLLLGVTGIGAALSTPVSAADYLNTKIVSCGEKSCLLVSGRRADANAQVALNGHAVTVEGDRKWRVRVPVDTVRAWSAPFAKTIVVSIAGVSRKAKLPIGMLLGDEHLAMLTVTAK